jgi:malonyl-CoA O-methyltransferase
MLLKKRLENTLNSNFSRESGSFPKMNLIQNQFSKNAKTYSKYNIIQNQVAEELLKTVADKPKNILDIGCGNGTIFKKIDWQIESFVGVDFSEEMLKLHPKNSKTTLFFQDFNKLEIEKLAQYKFDRIFSSSSLQWAENLEKTFQEISTLKTPIAFAIFTSGTFSTLHKTAKISSPLRKYDEVEKISHKYFSVQTKKLKYRLEFETKKEIFEYIKRSGVSGGKQQLTFRETKNLIKNYPINFLEFEIIVIFN